MRIALVSMHTSPSAVPGSGDAGGMNVVVAEAARALAARAHSVTVVTRASTEIAAGESSFQGDPAVRLVALPAGAPHLAKHELPGAVSEFAAGLRALGAFDAVHAHYWLSGVAARAALSAREQQIAMTFHTIAAQKNARLAPGDTPEPATRVSSERELAAHSFVVAGSSSELSWVDSMRGAECHDAGPGSAIVTPGVDTKLFRPLVKRYAGDQVDPLRITVLGRVQPLKGQDLAVRAASEIARSHPELFTRTEWVIAGEPTPGAEGYAASLGSLAWQLGVASNFRFLPAQSRSEAATLLRESALVLVPSHSETFGLTALEAAASGVPVIAGAHTGLLEAVPDGVAGELLPDREPSSWASAITRLLVDGNRRERLGASARVHAESHDWRAHAAALERIYGCLARPEPPGQA